MLDPQQEIDIASYIELIHAYIDPSARALNVHAIISAVLTIGVISSLLSLLKNVDAGTDNQDSGGD